MPRTASDGLHLNPLIHGVYNAIFTLSWPAFLLYYTLRARTDGKYRGSYRSRLGLDMPRRPSTASRVCWIHALSVGETISVFPLVKALKERYPEREIVFSTSTETGLAIARKQLAPWVGEEFFTLPHDFPQVMDALVRRLHPDLFILVETDIWPNLVHSLKRRGVPVVLVNGRLSRKSFGRLVLLRSLLKPVFRGLNLVFAQSADDKARYEALGAPAERAHALGNLKFDAAPDRVSREKILSLRQATGIEEGRPVWIAGSTHEGEEDILLRVHHVLRRDYPDILLILAPRNSRRAVDIASLCHRHGFSTAFRSTAESAKGKAVYLLDTLGELSSFYALADAAFIGGSLVPFGGHNPLEAVAQGKSAVWGPHLSNFREIEESLLQAGCGSRVSSEEELPGTLNQWLRNATLRHHQENAAWNFMTSHSGLARKIAEAIEW